MEKDKSASMLIAWIRKHSLGEEGGGGGVASGLDSCTEGGVMASMPLSPSNRNRSGFDYL